MIIGKHDINWDTTNKRWTCDCPDFKFRRSRTKSEICKHIKAALDAKHIEPGPEDDRYKHRVEFAPTVVMLEEALTPYQHEICGSWRRQAPFIKDIDVVILAESQRTIENLYRIIHAKGYIKYGGEKRITWEYIDPHQIKVQIDFRLCSRKEHWAPMILHFTGSKIENIRLRKKAISLGLSLSEYGLRNEILEFECKTEQQVYMFLKEEYKEPHLRA